MKKGLRNGKIKGEARGGKKKHLNPNLTYPFFRNIWIIFPVSLIKKALIYPTWYG